MLLKPLFEEVSQPTFSFSVLSGLSHRSTHTMGRQRIHEWQRKESPAGAAHNDARMEIETGMNKNG